MNEGQKVMKKGMVEQPNVVAGATRYERFVASDRGETRYRHTE